MTCWLSGILYSDSAKEHKRSVRCVVVGLHGPIEAEDVFAQHQCTHMSVTHEKKPGQRVQYCAPCIIVLPDGHVKGVRGRTEKIDGFWALLRRTIGKRATNTGRSGTAQREWFHNLVRVSQWHYWNLHSDRFAILGACFRAEREAASFC